MQNVTPSTNILPRFNTVHVTDFEDCDIIYYLTDNKKKKAALVYSTRFDVKAENEKKKKHTT